MAGTVLSEGVGLELLDGSSGVKAAVAGQGVPVTMEGAESYSGEGTLPGQKL